MSEKLIKARFQQKGKTEAGWYLDVYDEQGSPRENPFIPLKDEIIIFEKDDAGNNENRMKIGDGETNVMDLPFAGAKYVADNKLIRLDGAQFTTNIIHKGEVDNSFEIFDGEAKAEYSIAIGTNNKEPVKGIIGDLAANKIALANPTTKAVSSVAFGAGAETKAAGTMSLGILNTAGIKGYYWEDLEEYGNGYRFRLARTLKNFYTDLSGWFLATAVAAIEAALPGFKVVTTIDYVDPTTTDWVTGDTLTFVNDNQYVACATISDIDSTYVYVDSLPFSSSNYEAKTIAGQSIYVFNPDDKTVCACYEKQEFSLEIGSNTITNSRWYPRDGEIELGWSGTVFGMENLVTGSGGFAGGFNNWQAGNFGATFGRENIGGYYGLTSGGWNENKGWHSGVIGRDLINKGNYNFLTGRKSEVTTGVCNTVSGYDNTIEAGESNIVGGETNTVNGNYNIISGISNIIKAGRSAAFGYNNRLNHSYTFALGHTLTSASENQLIVGTNNIPVSNARFIIGNGTTDSSSKSNAMVVTASGNIIIGNDNIEPTIVGKSKKVVAVGANLNIGDGTYNSIITGYNNNTTNYKVSNVESSIITGDNINARYINTSIIGGKNIKVLSDKDTSVSSLIIGTNINSEISPFRNSAIIGNGITIDDVSINSSLILGSSLNITDGSDDSIISGVNGNIVNANNSFIKVYYSPNTEKRLIDINESIVTGAGHDIYQANDIAVFGLSHTINKVVEAVVPSSLLVAGDNNTTDFYSTFLLGNHLKAKCAEQTILGRYNVESTGFLVIGNGTKDAPSNIFTVNRDGTVTAGKDPEKPMDLVTKRYLENHSGGVDEDAVKDIVENMLLYGAW